MKPSFALDFRDGLIALLHRTSRGWSQVGASAVDAPDLAEALTYLRSTALGLSPRGLSTKLVIPNEMILYTQVHAPGPEVAKRRRQIKTALEGLTPYKVDDLVFDWWGSGPDVHVAVVARETLAEAEAFAVEHRFNPVSFVGAPDSGGYMGEPFFGPSALSVTLLSEGEKVERDQDPISVLARDFGKGPAAEAAVAEPKAEKPAPEPAAPEQVAGEAEVAELVEPEPPAPVMPASPAPLQREPAAPPPPVAAATAAPPNPLPDFSTTKAPAAGPGGFDPAAMAVELVDEAPMAVDVADDLAPEPPPPAARMAEAPAKSRPVEPPVVTPPAPASMAPAEIARDSDVPPSPASAVISAFASRRAAPEEPTDKPRKAAPGLGPAPQQRPPVPRPALAKPAGPLPSATRDSTVPFPGKSTGPGGKFAPGKSNRPMVSAPSALAAKRNVVQLPKANAEGEAAPVEAKTATGLDGRPVPPRGKPRYLGLILTGILLVALALVAAWSSFYLTSNEPDLNAPPAQNAVASVAPSTTPDTAATPEPAPDQTAATTPEPVAAPQDSAADPLPSVEDESLADGQDPAAATESVTAAQTPSADAPQADPVAEVAAPAPPAAEPVAAALPPPPEPAPDTVLSTEAAPAATQSKDPQDEIFLADADTPPQTSDPLSLPQLMASSDPPPALSAPPPPFGTLYTFDAEGRIQPTPEGIMTPEGVLLIAGRPPVVPPARPAQTPAAEPALAADAPVEPFPSDPALAGKRPKTRPAGFVDPGAATAKQGEALAPDTSSRFASLRPQARPAALTTQAAAVAPPEPDQADAANASLALNGVKPSTLATSRKPAARPSGMDQAVNAAVAAAARAPEPQRQAAAPEAEAEPEVENSAPALPTNASVARQATTKDAINLSRVALLGIFGTASGRYAMIRNPSGGVKKIKVGDNIDGGRVAAITANAVQYQKGNRMVTLELPAG